MRWLADVKGIGIYKTLIGSNLTGTENIASAAGESFDALFGDFSLALYSDSIPGTPKTSIPARNRFAVRNLRRMYQRLFDTSQGSSFVPRPFPSSPCPHWLDLGEHGTGHDVLLPPRHVGGTDDGHDRFWLDARRAANGRAASAAQHLPNSAGFIDVVIRPAGS